LTHTLRHVLAVESESQGEIPLQIVGRLWHEISPVAQQPRNIVPEIQAFAEHHGFQRMEFRLEVSHDAKVAAPASQSPEKIRIVFWTGVNNGPVSSHQCEAFDIVTGQSETPGQPPKASTQDQARSARMRNDTGGKYESVLLSSDVYRAEQASRREAGSTGIAANGDLAHS